MQGSSRSSCVASGNAHEPAFATVWWHRGRTDSRAGRRRSARPRRAPSPSSRGDATGHGGSPARGGGRPRSALSRDCGRSRSCSVPFEKLAQAGEAALHAFADHQLRCPGARRDVRVLVFGEHAREHRFALLARESLESRWSSGVTASAVASASTRSRSPSVISTGFMPRRRRARSSTAPCWAALTSIRLAIPYSHAAPGPFLRAVPVGAVERGRERLRGQVGRELGVVCPPREVRQQPVDVPSVEDREGFRLAAGRGEKVIVGASVHSYKDLLARSRRVT